MEVMLLGIYAAIVWLIFFKLKWLPWNTISMVIVITIPVVALTALILLLNVFAPSTADVRIIKYVVNIVPQVAGRVLEVPVEPNRPVKKGEVLFRIDPTPYELKVRSLEAQLASAEATGREVVEQVGSAVGGVAAAQGAVQQADARIRELQPKIDLARKRVQDNRELVSTGAGDRYALESAETDLKSLEAQLDTLRGQLAQARGAETQAAAGERQARQRLSGRVGTEYAPAAQVRADLERARWELSQTTVYAPAEGYVINLQLRAGSFTVAFPITPAMTFVENTYQVIATYDQNELYQVEPGNEAEFYIRTRPGHVFKAKVDSIIWAQGQGQVANTAQLPTSFGPIPAGRFPVKLTVDERDADIFLPAGAVGHGAIYTEHLEFVHILRKVLLRVSTKLDYLILKLH